MIPTGPESHLKSQDSRTELSPDVAVKDEAEATVVVVVAAAAAAAVVVVAVAVAESCFGTAAAVVDAPPGDTGTP